MFDFGPQSGRLSLGNHEEFNSEWLAKIGPHFLLVTVYDRRTLGFIL